MMKLTPQVIRAAAQDAGDRSMKKAGRRSWNEDDWNVACAKFEELTSIYDLIVEDATTLATGKE